MGRCHNRDQSELQARAIRIRWVKELSWDAPACGAFNAAEIMAASSLQWTLVMSSGNIMGDRANLRATKRNPALLASLEAFFITKPH
jgi:hypothetical protein